MWQELNKKDRLTLAVSASALIVSALTFYFSNLRVDDDLIARVVGTETLQVPEWRLSDESPGAASEHFETSLQVAIVNAGNRPAIVTEWQARFYDDRDNYLGSSIMSDQPTPFPLFVPSRDMRLISLRFPKSYFRRFVPRPGPGQVYEHFLIRAQIGFRSVDSTGRTHEAWSGMVYKWDVESGRDVSAAGSVHGWQAPIKLFSG